MQVTKKNIIEFLEGSDKNFTIPVYQRDYAWTKTQCKKMLEDIVGLENKDHYFIGAIVYIRQEGKWLIIDGQQRLTTCSLLLNALHNHLKSNENLRSRIWGLLVDIHANDDCKIKLKPNKLDREEYDKILKLDSVRKEVSNITNNYDFFVKELITKNPEEVYRLFKKLQFVVIELDHCDDPQLIFESLNSTGLSLSKADLIRNYILMGSVDQEKWYQDYWLSIEKFAVDVTEFARIYLMFKKSISIKKDLVYDEFKKYSFENRVNKYELLQDLHKYAQIYSFLIQTNEYPNKLINLRLSNFKKLDSSVANVFLMTLLDLNLQENVVIKVLEILESYIFRKLIIDGKTTGLNKFFVTLSKEIKKHNNWHDNFVDIFVAIILGEQGANKMPNNEQVYQELRVKNIYVQNSKNKLYLLENLENHNNPYKLSSETWQNLSIEHIMPQTITKQWKDRLGLNWEEIHSKYLHSLGNLTWTLKNSQMSNNDFNRKQNIDFDLSKMKLSYSLNKVTSWGEEEMLARAELLIEEFIEIWSYPKTKISLQKNYEDWVDISDDFIATRTSIDLIEVNGEQKIIGSWVDAHVWIAQKAMVESKIDFDNLNLPLIYSKSKDLLRRPKDINSGYFMETNSSADYKYKEMQKLAKQFGLAARVRIKAELKSTSSDLF